MPSAIGAYSTTAASGHKIGGRAEPPTRAVTVLFTIEVATRSVPQMQYRGGRQVRSSREPLRDAGLLLADAQRLGVL